MTDQVSQRRLSLQLLTPLIDAVGNPGGETVSISFQLRCSRSGRALPLSGRASRRRAEYCSLALV